MLHTLKQLTASLNNALQNNYGLQLPLTAHLQTDLNAVSKQILILNVKTVLESDLFHTDMYNLQALYSVNLSIPSVPPYNSEIS